MAVAIQTEQGFTREFAGVIGGGVRIIATDEIIKFLTPDSFEIDLGIKTKAIDTSNSVGHQTEAYRYQTENKPTAMFKLGNANTQNVALAANRDIQKVTGSAEKVLIQKQALVAQTPPSPPDGLGYGIAVDAVTNASAHMYGSSVPLVQQPWASFNAATPLSYAVGLQGAIKFSTDLITARAYVSLISIENIDIEQMLFNSRGLTEWTFMLRNSDDTMTKVFIPTININPEGVKLSSKSEGQEIKGNISITSGCAGYSVKDLKVKTFC